MGCCLHHWECSINGCWILGPLSSFIKIDLVLINRLFFFFLLLFLLFLSLSPSPLYPPPSPSPPPPFFSPSFLPLSPLIGYDLKNPA
jgi:hypothetical protein